MFDLPALTRMLWCKRRGFSALRPSFAGRRHARGSPLTWGVGKRSASSTAELLQQRAADPSSGQPYPSLYKPYLDLPPVPRAASAMVNHALPPPPTLECVVLHIVLSNLLKIGSHGRKDVLGRPKAV